MSGEVPRAAHNLAPTAEALYEPPTVAILDGGGQYQYDIEQQVKRLGFEARRVPFDTPLELLQGSQAIILSGGPESVYTPDAPQCDERLFKPEVDRPPVLGICYGAHYMTHALGGTVESLNKREDGFTQVSVDLNSALFEGLEPEQTVLMSHGDTVVQPAPGFEVTARSGELVAAIANQDAKLYGLQFHPEVSTVEGPTMLCNFLQEVAGLEPDYEYSMKEFVEDATREVREQVGDREVLAFVSGGVDSSALAALLERALPVEQLNLIYIDHGFMRASESEYVARTLGEAGIDLQIFGASEMFYAATTMIDDAQTPPLYEAIHPEVKRKIIGDTFIKAQDVMAEELRLDNDTFMLAMGTLHTDLIESGSKHASGKADTIKSHHNDTAAVRALREAGRVLEPWRHIQKDEVREAAKLLGLPDEIVNRQPFPGPGLAIRIICGDEARVDDKFYETEAQLQTFNSHNIQAHLLPVQTVGVQGDHRTYGHLVGLSGEQDWPQVVKLAKEIPRQVHGVNRVVYIFGEPPGVVVPNITPTRVTPETVEQLRQVDAIVNQKLAHYGLDQTISQVPVVLFPASFEEVGKRSIAIRTLMTTNFKTGDIAVPGRDFPEEVLHEIVNEIMQRSDIARVVYDVTSKPPATTEWE